MKKKPIKDKWIEFYQERKRPVLIGAGILAIAITALVLLLPQEEIIEGSVQYAEVIRGSITESISEVGTVESEPSAVLTWSSSGIVGEYDLEIGDVVSKDEVLMELEFSSWPQASLEAQSNLLEAELELENMITSNSELQTALQAAVDAEWVVWDKKQMRDYWNFGDSSDYRIDAVRTNYIEALQNVWVLEEEYDSLRTTLEEDDPQLIEAYDAYKTADLERDKYLRALSQILGTPYNIVVETDFIEYDQAKADLEQARAAYNRLLDESDEIAAAEANVQDIKNTINNARIIAPFDGTVTEISYLQGEYAEARSMAVQVDDLSNLVVNINVSELEIDKVEIGQPAIITFDALPFREYSGEVTDISLAGSDESGTVEFQVTISILDGDENIKPGYTTELIVITNQAIDALLVPTQALQGLVGDFMVMVVGEDGAPSPVPVEIGASSDMYIEVVEGDISEGDQLIITTLNNSDEDTVDMRTMMRQMNGDGGGKPSGEDRNQ